MKRLARLASESLASIDLEARVARALARSRATLVIAVGKAAPAMARGALRVVPHAAYLVVAPEGVDARGLDVMRAAHPVPDARSVRAAERCLAAVAEAEHTSITVLVSGGASSLLCAPAPGVTLDDKRAVTRTMLRSGASIQDLNVVRKHLSRIKGGGLARAAGSARIVTLVASDVIGGSASDIGSGPSVADASSVREARALLARHAPAYQHLPLVPTWRGASGAVRILASPEELARVMAKRLRREGLAARVLPPSQAPALAIAADYVARARRMMPGTAVVRAAEPSLAIAGRGGQGGRATHLAALVARDLPRGATFLAMATDGVDGTSGTAGAVVGRAFADREALDRALSRFDTGPLHLARGTAIRSEPTGHNLTDLHVLVVR